VDKDYTAKKFNQKNRNENRSSRAKGKEIQFGNSIGRAVKTAAAALSASKSAQWVENGK
jgi:hypothetical protein